VGRTYIVLKINEAVWFVNRSNPSTAFYKLDSDFWTTNWGATGTFTPGGDGRITYDPSGPGSGCSVGGGRWLAVERGTMTANGVVTHGYVLGASQGEDPTGVWVFYWRSGVGAADQPQLGFNTSWVAITANYFYGNGQEGNGNPDLYVFGKYSAECGGSLTGTLDVTGQPITSDQIGRSLVSACPAQTYPYFQLDLYANKLFIVNSDQPSSGTIRVSEITGSAGAPVFTPEVILASEGSSNAWSATLPSVPQAGSTTQIAPSKTDDRFNSCVVRNQDLYAVQTIGLPSSTPTSQAVQLWEIGINDPLGIIDFFGRIGGGQGYDNFFANSMDPSVAVNNRGDVLIGFSEVGVNSGFATSDLNSAYAFISNVRGILEQPYVYAFGGGPYAKLNGTTLTSIPTGDYSHSGVDPNDGLTLWTTEGYAGQQITFPPQFATWDWQSSMAFVTPNSIEFVEAQPVEKECSTNSCSVTVNIAPVFCIQSPCYGPTYGDVAVMILSAVDPGASLPTIPQGWTLLPINNQNNAQSVTSTDSCFGEKLTQWALAYKIDTNTTGTYTFTIPTPPTSSCVGTVRGEFEAFLSLYRGASGNLSNYLAYAYPYSQDSASVTVGPVTVPSNSVLLNLFHTCADEQPEGRIVSFSVPSGSPFLHVESPLTVNSVISFVADAPTGVSGGQFGPYSTTASCASLAYGWQILVPSH